MNPFSTGITWARPKLSGAPSLERARQRAGVVAGAGLGLLEVAEHLPGTLEEALAGRRQRDLAGGPGQQLGAEPRLELLDPAADGRGRTLQRAGGIGDAEALGDRDEGPEILEPVHVFLRTSMVNSILPAFCRDRQ